MKSYKAILLTAALLTISIFSYSQKENDARYISSFVYGNDLFNYQYKLTTNGVSSLKFEKVSSRLPGPETVISELTEVKNALTGKAETWTVSEESLQNLQTILTSSVQQINENTENYVQVHKELGKVLDTLKLYQANINNPDSATLQKEHEVLGELIDQISDLISEIATYVENSKEILIGDFNPTTVRAALVQKMSVYYNSESLKSNDLADLSQKIFYEATARKAFVNDRPSTAYLRLVSKSVEAYIGYVPVNLADESRVNALNAHRGVRSWFNRLLRWHLWRENLSYSPYFMDIPIQMDFVEASFEFETGTIKNLKAQFKVKGEQGLRELDFRNDVPIAVTNKFTPDEFYNHRIYASNPFSIDQSSLISEYLAGKSSEGVTLNTSDYKPNKHSIYFRLGDLIKYDIQLRNFTEDYSPEDVVVELSPQQSFVELNKQSRSKILTVKAFTDFNGIESGQPNGLIQFEASIGVNVRSHRNQYRRTYYGFLTRANLNGYLAKVEENGKYLPLSLSDTVGLDASGGQKQFYISPIDLYRYKNTGIDLELNVVKANFTSIMSNVQLNGTFGLFRSGVSDSLTIQNDSYLASTTRNDRFVNNIAYQVGLTWEFVPEGRYGFKVTASNTWIQTRNAEIIRPANLKGRIESYAFEGFINMNTESTSRLFFRWRYNKQASARNSNFNQIQLGYMVDVFKANQQ